MTKLLNGIIDLPSVRRTRRYLDVEMPNTVNFCPLETRVFSSYAWMTVDYCKVDVLIGVAPGESAEESDRIIEEIVREVNEVISESNEAGQRNSLNRLYTLHGFIQPRDEFVKRFEQAVDETQGSHKYSYLLSQCDGSFFYDAGVSTIYYGPGRIELGHSSCEYVSLKEVKEAAKTYAQASVNILGIM
jgi:succinyl-diaminopimelate desuccinylase